MDLEDRRLRFMETFGVEGLLLEVPLDLRSVEKAGRAYIEASRRFGGGDIYRAPNFTRNGDVRPRVEVREEFRALEVEVRRLFKEVLKGELDLVQRVLAVRVKGGEEVGGYSSAYLHSDTWAGEPSGGVVMIPIEGDFTNGGVEFFRPTKGSVKDFARRMETYEQVPDFGPEYLGRMKPGHLYVLDAFCLHRTMRGGYRCSVDFRFTYKQKIPGDFGGIGKRLANYVKYEDWSLYEPDKRM